jgi:hypothetical protein
VEWVVGLVVVTVVIVVRRLAIRRVTKGDRRFLWLYFAPTLILSAYLIWIGIEVWRASPVVSIFIGLLAVVSLVLLVRMIRGIAAAHPVPQAADELSPPQFDYIVWTALGAPMLFVAVLLILLVTGALSNSR